MKEVAVRCVCRTIHQAAGYSASYCWHLSSRNSRTRSAGLATASGSPKVSLTGLPERGWRSEAATAMSRVRCRVLVVYFKAAFTAFFDGLSISIVQ